MNLLIVDDEDVIREGIKRTVQHTYPNMQVSLANSPEEAARMLRSRPMDIVLTDVLMPGMTGLELMQLSRHRHPQVKWVVISAYSEFTYAQEAVRLGAKDYLLKPIGKELLVQTIEKLIAEIKLENEQAMERNQFKQQLKYVREAVFQRLASGLDLGWMDLTAWMKHHPTFRLIMVRMDSDRSVQLEHFMIENVLGECIEREGKGFTTSLDEKSLVGLITLREDRMIRAMVDSLRIELNKVLKVPFQVMVSEVMHSFSEVSREVARMRQEALIHIHDQETGGQSIMEVAVQYMKANYHTDLSLEKVAAIVYLNPAYFSQLFKQKVGYGFKEYMTQLRMEQAKLLLLNTPLKLADIAERIGYQDVKHFTQVFRKKHQATPTEYRNAHLAQQRLSHE